MTFKPHCQMSKGMVDPAPLVDVVFLLLLFFLLSSPFVMQSGFGVDLTQSSQYTISTFQALVVTVTRDNLLFYNNQPITLAALEPALRDALQAGRARELVIKADRQVSHGAVTQVMGAALRAGITIVNIAARAETAGAGAPN
jgi:biopolymer transport protein ExbD